MPRGAPSESAVRRVGIASLMGTTIEYYDFIIYGTAAALVFPQVFFPTASPVAGTLLSFATFGVAFVARPLGGVVFGHFGDRVGRKAALVVTLLTMGLATVAIGLVPSYDSIGVAAPVILVALRFIQGIALGGEYGGAVLMTVEHSPPARRGFYASWVQTGAQFGLIGANLVILGVGALVGDDAFTSWGWRIPFLTSIVLVAIGIAIRLRLEESPEFTALKESSQIHTAPALVVLREHKTSVLLIAGAAVGNAVTFYATSTWGLTYGISLGLTRAEMLTAVIIGAAWVIVAVVAFGALSDRIGRKPVFIAGNLGMALLIWPWVLSVQSLDLGTVIIGYLAVLTGYAATWGTIGVMFSEVFRGAVRYTGLSVGFTIGVIIGGAVTPLVLTQLVATYSSPLPVVLWVAGAALISILCCLPLAAASRHDAVATPVQAASTQPSAAV